jgi:hypothetical protein
MGLELADPAQRMQVEHLFELDFLKTHSNVIFIGPTSRVARISMASFPALP